MSVENNVAIIGAGQLGSRHLQALGYSNYNIFVVDPNPISLKTAESRFDDVNSNFTGTITYLENLNDLPNVINVCIVATNSIIRSKIIENVLKYCEVKNFILEKVLFATLEEYETVAVKLISGGSKAWVNCPRRMMAPFKKLKKLLNSDLIQMQVVGNNWGLGCNGIHNLDLFAFLTANTELTLIGDNLDNTIHASKRDGFIEFTGTIIGYNQKGDTFSITSNDGDITAPFFFMITSKNVNSIIQQKGNELDVSISSSYNNWVFEKEVMQMPFQSNLTNIVVNDILTTGNCELTSFEESSILHKVLISCLLKKMEIIEQRIIEICPIT